MKLSKFNHIKDLNDGTLLIYNTLTSGVLRLNQEYSNYFQAFEKGECEINAALENNLIKGGMIVDNDIDEINALNLSGKLSKFSTNSLGLTIAPTLACNFKCPYCYEKGAHNETMSQDTQKRLVEFVKSQSNNVKTISITWYGGEPLLVFPIVEDLSKEIVDICEEKNIQYESGMVTNGYLLSIDYAERMSRIGISSIQVTIDGDAEQHNQRRICHDGSCTYDAILDNIEKCCNLLRIVIRVNVDKNNLSSFNVFLEDLKQRRLSNKVNVYLAPVDDTNDAYMSDKCLSITQFSDLEIDFYSKLMDNGFSQVRMPTAMMGYCGAVSVNSFVIDPEGVFYKCWYEVGRVKSNVGNLLDGIKLNSNHSRWIFYDAFNDTECMGCKMLPICFGGCPDKALSSNSNKCKTTKYNVDKMLDLLNSVDNSDKK